MIEVELLDRHADAATTSLLPRRLAELAVVATEVAQALRAHQVSPQERERILARATALAGLTPRRRRRNRLPISGRAAAGAGSAAALTLALIGVAFLRRTHLRGGATALGRAV